MQPAHNEQMARAAAERKLTEQPAGSTDGVLPANSEGMTWDRTATGVTVTVSGDVLFDSGKATLKASAKKSLDSVAKTLKSQYANLAIRVEGHTDTDPIKRASSPPTTSWVSREPTPWRTTSTSKGVSSGQISVATAIPVPREPSPPAVARNLSRHAVTHSHVHQFTYRSQYRGGQSSSVRRFLFFVIQYSPRGMIFGSHALRRPQLSLRIQRSPSPCLEA